MNMGPRDYDDLRALAHAKRKDVEHREKMTNEEDPGKWWDKCEAFHRKIKRKAHYKELKPLPRCCLSCRYGRFTEDYAVCYRIHYGEFGYPDINHFGICDHYQGRKP